jgi:hypothetical protein
MIKIITDEEVHESDIELIELFGVTLIDRDKATMADLLYLVEDRMAGDCICFEETCICSKWN